MVLGTATVSAIQRTRLRRARKTTCGIYKHSFAKSRACCAAKVRSEKNRGTPSAPRFKSIFVRCVGVVNVRSERHASAGIYTDAMSRRSCYRVPNVCRHRPVLVALSHTLNRKVANNSRFASLAKRIIATCSSNDGARASVCVRLRIQPVDATH